MITRRETNRTPAFKPLFFISAIALSILLFSCSEKISDQEVLVPKEVSNASRNDDIWIEVWEMPTFKGKDIGYFWQWVNERVKFPDDASLNGIQGKAFIGFCVEADGSLSNVTVLRGLHKLLDEEVVRVVQSSPAWEPGLIQGVPARVRFSITVPYPPK